MGATRSGGSESGRDRGYRTDRLPGSVGAVQGFQRVLAPIDFSPLSARVVEMAGRVVDPHGEIVLLHVIDWVPSVVEGAFVVAPNPKETRALHEEALAKLGELRKAHPDLPARADVVEGQPATEIVDYAEHWRADLLVIGSHGRSGLVGHLLLGSVAERVLRHARCTVLTVRV